MSLTPFIAGITDTRAGSPTRPYDRAGLSPLPIYIEIVIEDEQETVGDRFARISRRHELASLCAGRTYVIRARTVSFPSSKCEQRPLSASKRYDFSVGCPHSELYGFEFSESEFSVEDLRAGIFFESRLRVPDECPHGQIDLMLLFSDDKHFEDQAACIHLSIEGTHFGHDDALENDTSVDLSAANPEKTIILYARPTGDDRFQIEGWARRDRPRRRELHIQNPHIELATFIESHVKPDSIHTRIREWVTGDPGGVLGWLYSLYSASEDVLDLIIVDETGYEVPWEMLEFDLTDESVALGAVMRITRWVKILQNYAPYRLGVQDDTVTGHVLCHIDNNNLNRAQDDVDALAHFSVTTRNNLKGFITALRSLKSLDVGLIYLGCHGVFSVSARHKNLLDDAIANGRIALEPSIKTLSYLNLYELPYLKEKRPVFFVNACHSARILHEGDGTNTTRAPLGLPIVALQRLARGYIGTIGPVGDLYAGTIARKILEGISSGSSIPEALRLVRAEAYQEFMAPADDNTEVAKKYIYTFMYVFYGNPMTYMRLKQKSKFDGADCE